MSENVTHKDLSEAKEKFYWEIKECRHGWKNQAQSQAIINDDYGKDIALLKQSMINWEKTQDEIKTGMKDFHIDIKSTFIQFLKDIDKKYATKAELESEHLKTATKISKNSYMINFLYGTFWTIWGLLITWFITNLLKLI
jgi:hypothetical protein